ncbi:hypothetical protein FB561_6202 [Kribbella amoyensis]|uniref:Uncharacterized protein n=1 Tax=Kribbella amoyensis TaxID=996641 RepID=A0A561B7G0_9ACTN|nr:hypothetical protein [Kribbella amoyensis]TWD74770.1 hypothetical protein FB561_6202 [Kribbella amoyensis]
MSELEVPGEAPEADAPTQYQHAEDRPGEANPADVEEQRRTVSEDEDEAPGETPPEADPADVEEQRRAIGEDDDPYR